MTQLKLVRSVEQHIVDVRRSWQKLNVMWEKGKADRLALALDLKALRDRVEAGEMGDQAALDWWNWYESKFTQPRDNAEVLLRIAGAADPPKMLAVIRDQTKARVAKHRSNKKKTTLTVVANPISERRVTEACNAPSAEPEINKADVEAWLNIWRGWEWPQRRYAISKLNKIFNERFR